MSSVLIALIVAAGSGIWIYNKFMRRTGGAGSSAIIIAIVISTIWFVILWTILNTILPE